MSSSVCQGLQSCLEPTLVEPIVLRHKLTPPKLNFSQSDNNCCGDWSCIQTLTNTSHNSKEVTNKDNIYVHPLVKCSSSILSMKSLEMCTESLGSETGSDIMESYEFSSLLSENQNFHTMHRSKPRKFSKKVIVSDSFPPPLSSISGIDSVQLRPHREGGRLVLKAVSVSSSRNTYLEAKRVNGRVKLCLLKDCSPSCETRVTKDEVNECSENGDEEQCVYDGDSGGVDGWSESNGGNVGNVGCEIGIAELPRPSRCKEGGSGEKEMSSWGPLHVAIS